MSVKNTQQHSKDKELVEAATSFFRVFAESAKTTDAAAIMARGQSYSFSEGNIVELTDVVLEAQSKFVHRAATLLTSRGAHEKAITSIATDHAHKFVAATNDLNSAVGDMIKEVFEKGNASFEYLVPNYLVKLRSGISEITIGRVRALRTETFSAEWANRYPENLVEIIEGTGFSLQLHPKRIITLTPVCWVIGVDAVAENVEEEGKWLLDVAISYLRLRHKKTWSGGFPRLGEIEPHPLRASLIEKEGAKLEGSKVLVGGSRTPPWYEIDAAVIETTQDPNFISQAKLIFDAQKKSLAERVSQGLGWLTRGRQADDRAERLLYFFTAIEALLSRNDKTAPVVQTIARHAAVLLSNDNVQRAAWARELMKLYELRSALVHNGTRSVLWSAANYAEFLAEAMFRAVLENADLQRRHEDFCNELAGASYGMPWSESAAP
jgi:hypothetical protein